MPTEHKEEHHVKKEVGYSKNVRNILIAITVVIVLLAVLQVGIIVGTERARFSDRFGEGYRGMFIGPHAGHFEMFLGRGFEGGHGAVGKIVSLSLPDFVVEGPDNIEKTIIVGTSTLVRNLQSNIDSDDLKVNDEVIVLGNPNTNGQIEATFIRVVPKDVITQVEATTSKGTTTDVIYYRMPM